MLHIITPLYRFENLEKIYSSILINDDITWHISKSNKREEIKYNFIKTDKRIKIYDIECEDNEAYLKRKKVLEQINEGYFCFLDDDTLFHENMYIKYLECKEQNFIGMLVGQQIDTDGKLRLIASKPIYCHIDVGNVLCHTSCLKSVSWPTEVTQKYRARDFLFWDSVFNFFEKKCAIWNQPISFYNKLRLNNYDSKKKNK
jgi:hypothetical protein